MTDTATDAPTKPPKAPPKPAPAKVPDGIPVRALYLRESLDIGRGDCAEQQVSTLSSGRREGKLVQYRILWLPRDRMFHIRVYRGDAGLETATPLRTLLLDPTGRVLAEIEAP